MLDPYVKWIKILEVLSEGPSTSNRKKSSSGLICVMPPKRKQKGNLDSFSVEMKVKLDLYLGIGSKLICVMINIQADSNSKLKSVTNLTFIFNNENQPHLISDDLFLTRHRPLDHSLFHDFSKSAGESAPIPATWVRP